MRALRDGARTQGDRKGSPLLETAWQADPPVYSRGWACPCPAALHSFFHSPAKPEGLVKIPRIFLAQPLSTTLAHVLDKSALYGNGISHAMIESHAENRG